MKRTRATTDSTPRCNLPLFPVRSSHASLMHFASATHNNAIDLGQQKGKLKQIPIVRNAWTHHKQRRQRDQLSTLGVCMREKPFSKRNIFLKHFSNRHCFRTFFSASDSLLFLNPEIWKSHSMHASHKLYLQFQTFRKPGMIQNTKNENMRRSHVAHGTQIRRSCFYPHCC